MNEKAQKKLNDILIECGYSHKETKDVVKRYDKNTDQLFKLGKIDFRKEATNGEIIQKKEDCDFLPQPCFIIRVTFPLLKDYSIAIFFFGSSICIFGSVIVRTPLSIFAVLPSSLTLVGRRTAL